MSYSSFSLAEKDIEEFYLKYLADNRPPRRPQEPPASVGSAFDAYAKHLLHLHLFGAHTDEKYEFQTLFESQVEKQNWDFAITAGKRCFKAYEHTGAFRALLEILETAIEPPRFEFDTSGDLFGVPYLGKPDCHALLPNDINFVHDFKVNGYCSKSATSPNKGYMICRDGYVCPKGKQSRGNGTAHKQYVPMDYKGMTIDTGYLEDCSTGWADQLSLYGWSLGEPVGSPNTILSVDQIVCKPVPAGPPLLRVANFRSRVRKSYQEHLVKRFTGVWEMIQSGYIFRYLSEEESAERMKLLDGQSTAMSDGAVGPHADFFNEVVRPAFRG